MILRIVAAVAIAAGLAACTVAPIYNVQDQAVATASGKAPSSEQVRSAILGAGAQLGWQMKDVKPGVIEASINLRTHTAVVEVAYNTKTYSIAYKSSVNLNEASGQIHKNYNGWIQNLERGINARISALN